MILIGLTGKAGVGKDTAALYLNNTYDLHHYAFAAPLRRMVEALIGKCHWDDREWKERTIDWIGKSPRQLLQTLGTEWGREQVNSELWVRKAEHVRQQLGSARFRCAGMVISDVRFPNEAEWLVAAGGILIELRRGSAAGVAAHVSEQHDLSRFVHHVVENNGTRRDLHERLNAIVTQL